MAMFSVGDLNNNPKLNQYQQQSQKIIKEYENDNQEIKLSDYLKSSANNLKKLKLIKTRQEIEIIRYNYTGGYPVNLDENIIKQKLQFFSAIIGFIDGLIDSYSRDIRFFEYFDGYDNQLRIKDDQNKKITLLNKKVEVLGDFNEIQTVQIPEIVFKTLEGNPAYKNFSNLYQYFADEHITYDFQTALANAYNVGYKSPHQKDNEIFDLYKKLYNEIKQDQDLLKLNLEKEKVLAKKNI